MLYIVMIEVCLLKSLCIPSFVLIGCCMSELHGCPYCNVLPEAVYCYFTRTTHMFVLEVAFTSASFVTLHLLVSEIAKCIAWGCLLLFYNNYIVYYIFVWAELEVAFTPPSFITLHLLVSDIAQCIAWGCLLLFYKNYIVYQIVYDQTYRLLSHHQVSLLYTFWFLR